MTIIFRPKGSLDLNTDPSAMESGAQGSTQTGETMQRCKNLRLDAEGLAVLRYGAKLLNSSAMSILPNFLIEQGGIRYSLGSAIYRNESQIASGYTDALWSGLKYNAYNSTTESIYALNGYERVKINSSTVTNWGVDAPSFEFSLEAWGSYGLTGEFNAKVTLCTFEDSTLTFESTAGSAASSSIDCISQALIMRIAYDGLDNLDSQITHIRLYRTTTNGLIYYFDKTFDLTELTKEIDFAYTYAFEMADAYISGTGYLIADQEIGNSITGYKALFYWELTYDTATDTANLFKRTQFLVEDIYLVASTSDTSLSITAPSNHDRPVAGSFTLGPNFNGTCFILFKNYLYFCLPKQPEYWPATYYVEVSPIQEPLIAGIFYTGQLYLATKNSIYSVPGAGAQTFFPVKQAALTGIQGKKGLYALDGIGIFHVGSDGLYLFSLQVGDKKFTADKLDRIFRGETVNDVPGAGDLSTAWIIQFKNRIYFGYASSSNTYPQNVFVVDMASRKITYYDWGIEIPHITHDLAYDRLICIDTNGYSWQLEDETLTKDNNLPISWDIESQAFTLQTRAHFPRWIKYDVNAASSTSAIGKVVLDGSTLQNHTLSGNRSTKRRLITTGNGQRCSMRITGSGPITVYAMESE
jgi:hypothetical protein